METDLRQSGPNGTAATAMMGSVPITVADQDDHSRKRPDDRLLVRPATIESAKIKARIFPRPELQCELASGTARK